MRTRIFSPTCSTHKLVQECYCCAYLHSILNGFIGKQIAGLWAQKNTVDLWDKLLLSQFLHQFSCQWDIFSSGKLMDRTIWLSCWITLPCLHSFLCWKITRVVHLQINGSGCQLQPWVTKGCWVVNYSVFIGLSLLIS